MKTVKYFLIILIACSCQSRHGRDSATTDFAKEGLSSTPAEPAEMLEESADIEKYNADYKIKQPDKIIKEADIKFEVDDYIESRKKLQDIINKWGAYISKEDERYTNFQITNTITIRVLSKNFEKLINDIGTVSAKVDYKTINAYDVTEEYIDIESRLKTKREVEKRYYEILRKAYKIDEILEVENEIRKIREEIEAAEGRLKYLNDRVSYSTVTLTIYQQAQYKYRPEHRTDFFERFYKGLDKGWKGLLSFIIGLAHIWPLLLAMGIAAYFIIRYLKKERKERNRSAA
jgi:hypothetical protein